MKFRSVLIVAIVPIAALLVWRYLRTDPETQLATAAAPKIQSATKSVPETVPSPSPDLPSPKLDLQSPTEDRIDLADALNEPGGTIGRDLETLQAVFAAWITNFPREGNPVGENAEITAALMGKNSLELALIPPGHRAINARGELVDRWGTPFRLHQISGTRMQIQSAGPDRKFATADDAVSNQ